MAASPNRYAQIIEQIFLARYQEGDTEIPFEREEIERVAAALGIPLPKNLGDLIYSFRYHVDLPDAIRRTAPEGREWIIQPAGRSRYRFAAVPPRQIAPSPTLAETRIPDATPGIIARYALSDEQALLAKLRYNRLIDIFTGVACYSLQNHLRTTVPGLGQVETDEIYVGIDRRGAQWVFPVQAKGGRDRLSIVQIEQDYALCASKFPDLLCRPIAAQFMGDNLIALFAFEPQEGRLAVAAEKHYRLASPDAITTDELRTYGTRFD